MEIKEKIKLLNQFFLKINIPVENDLLARYYSSSLGMIEDNFVPRASTFFHYKNYISIICEYLRETKDFKILLVLLDQGSDVIDDIIEHLTFRHASILDPHGVITQEAINASLDKLKAKIAILIDIHGGIPEGLNDLLEAIDIFEAHNGGIRLGLANFLLNTWHNNLEVAFPVLNEIVLEQPVVEHEAAELGLIEQLIKNAGALVTFIFNHLFVEPHAAVVVVQEPNADQAALVEPGFVGHIAGINEGGCG